MAIETTYTQARTNLKRLLDAVSEDHETVIIKRRQGDAVAMISEADLSGLMETAYLLRSPANARRLLSALGDALEGKGERLSIEELKRVSGLEG